MNRVVAPVLCFYARALYDAFSKGPYARRVLATGVEIREEPKEVDFGTEPEQPKDQPEYPWFWSHERWPRDTPLTYTHLTDHQGGFQEVTARFDGADRHFLIKEVPSKAILDTEQQLSRQFDHSSVWRGVRFFTEGNRFLIACAMRPGAWRQLTLPISSDIAERLVDQYWDFLSWCNREKLVYQSHNFENVWHTDSDLALVGCEEAPSFDQAGTANDYWESLQAFADKVNVRLLCSPADFLRRSPPPGSQSAFGVYQKKRERWDQAWHLYNREIEQWHDRKTTHHRELREWKDQEQETKRQADDYQAQQALGLDPSQRTFSIEQWLEQYNDVIVYEEPGRGGKSARTGTSLVTQKPFVALRHALSFANSLISEFWLSGDPSGVKPEDFPAIRPDLKAIRLKLKQNADSLAATFEEKRRAQRKQDKTPALADDANWLEYTRTMACVIKVEGKKLPRNLFRVEMVDTESSKQSQREVKWWYRIGWIVGPEKSPCYSFPNEAHGSVGWRIEPDRDGVWHSTVVDILTEGSGPIDAEYACYVCVANDDAGQPNA